ncbi:hypothetical protein N2152v2_009008 [Parachlorella kessleri]
MAQEGMQRQRVILRESSLEEEQQPAEEPTLPTEFVEVGVVGPPHGVRGEVKVQPLTDFPKERLGTPGTRWLRAPVPKLGRRRALPPTAVELEYGRTMISKGNEVWIVKLEGVESPEEAQLLRGHSLLIPATARKALADEDEFYVQDLVGLRVFLAGSQEELGLVVDLFDGTGTHDVLRIQLHEQQQQQQQVQDAPKTEAPSTPPAPRFVLLPFAKALVPAVDVAAGLMEISPPEGLLELASSSAPKQQRRESRGRRERRRSRPGTAPDTSSEGSSDESGSNQGSSQPEAAGAAAESEE